MTLYTIGFTQKSARQFFTLLCENNIDLLLDIRLNNKSQLAGFTKGEDLSYFLSEICDCSYRYCPEYAPTKELMDGMKGGKVTYEDYRTQYEAILEERGDYKHFLAQYGGYERVCLLCSEAEPDICHRKILAEAVRGIDPSLEINHL